MFCYLCNREIGIREKLIVYLENKELKAAVYGRLRTVQDKAIERLMLSLNLLDDEKLEKCNATDLSKVAANMSRVVDRTIPKESSQGSQVNLVLYAPKQKDVSD